MTDLAENAERALRMVREAPLLVYDTESTGVDWRIHSPVGYVVGAPQSVSGRLQDGDVVYVPVRHGGGGNLLGGRPMTTPAAGFEPHPWEADLAKAFDGRNRVGLGRVVGHNMKFDVHFSANAGVLLGRKLACTQNQEALLDEYTKSYSLEACALRHEVTAKLGEGLYKHLAMQFGGAADRNQMGNYWRLPGTDPTGYEYATGDGVTTYELYLKQKEQIEEENLELVADLENDLIWTVFRMERRGIKIDLDRVQELRAATEARIRAMLEEFPVGFNVRSPLMIRELMEQSGHTNWPKTEKGNPSFTEKFLKQTPLGRKIIEIRQSGNLLNSFVDPLAERHVYRGRVHTTLNQLKSDDKGTISGRFSSSEPNIQQVPKRIKELAKPFRRLFVADEGYVFWERDYSQCEPRLFAHYSRDENLLAGYNSEPFVDAHQTVANLLGVERDPTAKRMNMGILTGMQVRAFANHMGWPEDRAAEAWNKWFEAFPSIRDFQNKAKYRLSSKGYVMTLLKRRCRLEDPRFAYRGTSKIIQGSNADIIKWKLLEADRMCENSGDIVQVLLTVHDSFAGQFQDTKEARELFEHIEERLVSVQEPPFNLSVPFMLDGNEGGDWSEATFGRSAS